MNGERLNISARSAIRRRLVATAAGVAAWDIHKPQSWTGNAWSPVLPDAGDYVCLYRSGRRLRRSGGFEEYIDATTAFAGRAGVPEQLAGDGIGVFTMIKLTPEAYDTYVSAAHPRRGWLLRPDSGFDYRHRRLLALARAGIDGFEASEGVVTLLDALPGPIAPPAERAHHRRLVMEAQELLATEAMPSVDELARRLATSAGHLSRTFRRLTGRTISAYRNELRVRAVLQRLAEGADDLSELAAEFGFADHAHLTRTVKRHVGRSPSQARRELSVVA
jgi:AraC-like DNA-binding protein